MHVEARREACTHDTVCVAWWMLLATDLQTAGSMKHKTSKLTMPPPPGIPNHLPCSLSHAAVDRHRRRHT